MSPVCFVYNITVRNPAETNELNFGEELRGMVSHVLAGASYKGQCDRDYDRANHNVSRSNGMEDMVKVQGDVIKPRTHTKVFCSASTYAVYYKAFAVEKVEMQAVTRKESEE